MPTTHRDWTIVWVLYDDGHRESKLDTTLIYSTRYYRQSEIIREKVQNQKPTISQNMTNHYRLPHRFTMSTEFQKKRKKEAVKIDEKEVITL